MKAKIYLAKLTSLFGPSTGRISWQSLACGLLIFASLNLGLGSLYGQTLDLGNLSTENTRLVEFNRDLILNSYGGQAVVNSTDLTVDYDIPDRTGQRIDFPFTNIRNASIYFGQIGGDNYYMIPTPDGVLLSGTPGQFGAGAGGVTRTFAGNFLDFQRETLQEIRGNYGANIEDVSDQNVSPSSILRPSLDYRLDEGSAFEDNPLTYFDFLRIDIPGDNPQSSFAPARPFMLVSNPTFALGPAYDQVQEQSDQLFRQTALGGAEFIDGISQAVSVLSYFDDLLLSNGNSANVNFQNLSEAQRAVATTLWYYGIRDAGVYYRFNILGPDNNPDLRLNPQLINDRGTDNTTFASAKSATGTGAFKTDVSYLDNSGNLTFNTIYSDNTNLALSPPSGESFNRVTSSFSDIALSLDEATETFVQNALSFGESFAAGNSWNLSNGNVSTFDGVDFTNLSVAGISIDEGTKVVNFLLEGQAVAGNSGENFGNVGDFQKKIFLQALAIPNENQFVDMDIITDAAGNPTGFANADNAFKQTDMCRLFFAADEQMKRDLNVTFYGLNTPDNVYNDWDNILRQNTTIYNQMVATDRYYPFLAGINARGLIVPELPDAGEGENNVFISNSQYDLLRFLEGITIQYKNLAVSPISDVDESAVPASIRNYVNQQLPQLVALFTDRLDIAADIVENMINSNTHPTYEDLNVMLPAIVAAQWYKQQPIPSKQFGYLINTNVLTEAATGISIASDIPFDQAYWDSRSYQNLQSSPVSIDISPGGTLEFVAEVRGGVNTQADLNSLSALSGTQANIFDDATEIGATANAGSDYIVGGTLEHNLPELTFNLLRLISKSTNVEDTWFEVGQTTEVFYSVINTGKADAGLVRMKFYYQTIDAAGNPVGPLTQFRDIIQTMPSGDFAELSGKIALVLPSTPTRLQIIGEVFRPASNLVDLLPEVTFANNVARKNCDIGIAGPREEPLIRDNTVFDENTTDYGYTFAETVDQVIVNPGVNVDIDARDYVRLSPGFIAESGSRFRSRILSNDPNPAVRQVVEQPSAGLEAAELIIVDEEDMMVKNETYVFDETVTPLNLPGLTQIKFRSGGGSEGESVEVAPLAGWSSEASFTAYPNPFRDNLSLTISRADEVVAVQLMNSIGQMVLTQDQVIIEGKEIQIWASNLVNGTYLVMVDYADGTREISKVTRQ